VDNENSGLCPVIMRAMPGWSRDCENCGERYVATYPTQRWCCAECREEFRNAELRAARLLWRKATTPIWVDVVAPSLDLDLISAWS